MSRRTEFVLFASVWLCFLAGGLAGLTALRVTFALPALFVLPGLAMLRAIRVSVPLLEAVALTLACSMAVLAADMLALHVSPWRISATSVPVSVAVSTVVLVLAGVFRTRSSAPPAALVDVASVACSETEATIEIDRAPLQASLRHLLPWAAAIVVGAAILSGAVDLSVVSERAVAAEVHFTQLSLLPDGAGARRGMVMAVRNQEGRTTPYRIEISAPGRRRTDRNVTLQDGKTFHEQIMPTRTGLLVVRLHGGSSTSGAYREVRMQVPPR
jgi:uncharacterized membrane protein